MRVHHHVGENLDLVDCHEEPEIPLWQLQHLLNLRSLPQEFFWLATFEAERVYDGLWVLSFTSVQIYGHVCLEMFRGIFCGNFGDWHLR